MISRWRGKAVCALNIGRRSGRVDRGEHGANELLHFRGEGERQRGCGHGIVVWCCEQQHGLTKLVPSVSNGRLSCFNLIGGEDANRDAVF